MKSRLVPTRSRVFGFAPLRAAATLLSLLLVTVALAGCPDKEVVPDDASREDAAWRKQSLALSVQGYMFSGGLKPQPAAWSGSAAWIAPDMAVTNAHVALRSLKITGQDDTGQTFEFDKVLAIDQSADLAIIKAKKRSDAPHLDLLGRPSEPKTLRGRNVRVIGNTGGLGLSFYDGRVINVVGDEGAEVILHDTSTAGGSSGGPLYETGDGQLLGVNHSSLPSLNAKAAAPSWIVAEHLEASKARQGLPLQEAFDTANMPVNWYVERATCLQPGQVFKGAFNAVATNDLVVQVEPAQPGQVIAFFLFRGQSEMGKGVIHQKATAVFTLPGGGQYVYALANPQQMNSQACATVRFGRIDWSQRLQ